MLLNATYSSRLLALFVLVLLPAALLARVLPQECDSCNDRCLNVAIKSNLLHDALLTPDFGIEIALPANISVGVEGVYAWWSKDKAHRYWRIRGAWLDIGYWFGSASHKKALTGHHAGIYVSSHDYDFEFGGKGWQSRRPAFGAGVTYGYSFSLNNRLNLDLSLRIGYSGSHITRYVPQCGEYICTGRYNKRYFGVTGITVSLVWFPGKKSFNNPAK